MKQKTFTPPPPEIPTPKPSIPQTPLQKLIVTRNAEFVSLQKFVDWANNEVKFREGMLFGLDRQIGELAEEQSKQLASKPDPV